MGGGGVGQRPSQIYGILPDTVNMRALRMLLECSRVQYIAIGIN